MGHNLKIHETIQKIHQSSSEEQNSKWRNLPLHRLLDPEYVQSKYNQLLAEGNRNLPDAERLISKLNNGIPKVDECKPNGFKIGVSFQDERREMDMAKKLLFVKASKGSDTNVLLEMEKTGLREKSPLSHQLDRNFMQQQYVYQRILAASGQEQNKTREIEKISDTTASPMKFSHLTSLCALHAQLGVLRMVQETHPEKMYSVLESMVESFQSVQALQFESIVSNSSDGKVFKALVQFCREIMHTSALNLVEMACCLLLVLGVSTGKSYCLLLIADAVRAGKCSATFYEKHCSKLCGRMIKAMQSYKVQLDITIMDDCDKMTEIPCNVKSALPSTTNSAIATDGAYLYVLSDFVVSKIGTGYGGTTPGRLYASSEDFSKTQLQKAPKIMHAFYGFALHVTENLQNAILNAADASINTDKKSLFATAISHYLDATSIDAELVMHLLSDASLYVEYHIESDENVFYDCMFEYGDIIEFPDVANLQSPNAIKIDVALFGVFDDVTSTVGMNSKPAANNALDAGKVTREELDSDIESNLWIRVRYGNEFRTEEIRYGEAIFLKPLHNLTSKNCAMLCLFESEEIYITFDFESIKSATFAIQTSDLCIISDSIPIHHLENSTGNNIANNEASSANSALLEISDMESIAAVVSSHNESEIGCILNSKLSSWDVHCSEGEEIFIDCCFHAESRCLGGIKLISAELCPLSEYFSITIEGRQSFYASWEAIHMKDTDMKCDSHSMIEFHNVESYQMYRISLILDQKPSKVSAENLRVTLNLRQILFFEREAKIESTKTSSLSSAYFSDGTNVFAAFYSSPKNVQVLVLDSSLIELRRLNLKIPSIIPDDISMDTLCIQFCSNRDRILVLVADQKLIFDSYTGDIIKQGISIQAQPCLPVYDPINNIVWQYIPSTLSIEAYKSKGLSLRQTCSVDTIKGIETTIDQTVDFLEIVCMHSEYYLDSTIKAQTSKASDGRVPWCVDLDIDSLNVLVTNTEQLCIKYIENNCTVEVDMISYFKILELNMSYLLPQVWIGELNETRALMVSLKSPILQILKLNNSNSRVKQQALKFMQTAVHIFYPERETQQNLVVDLLQKRILGTSNVADTIILDTIMQKLSDFSSTKRVPATSQFMERLCEFSSSLCMLELDGKFTGIDKLENKVATLASLTLNDEWVQVGLDLSSFERKLHFAISCCLQILQRIVDHEIQTDDQSSEKRLNETADAILEKSIVGKLLPPMVCSCLAQLHNVTNARSSINMVQSIASPLQEALKLLSLINSCSNIQNSKTTISAITTSKYKTKIFESTHPYESNVHSLEELSIPGAARIVISFDDESKTEHEYDFVAFYKDRTMTEVWGQARYSGRGDDHNFPGVGKNDDLIIEADHCFVQFHTDATGVDWGWKFTATAELVETTETTSLHWLLRLEENLAFCLGKLSQILYTSETLTPVREVERNNSSYLQQHLFRGGRQAPSIMSQFLKALSAPEEGTSEIKVLDELKRVTMEDQGNVQHINEAVRAVGAAILHHNMIGMDLMEFSAGKQSNITSPTLNAWKNAQKMRQWFDFGDAAASATKNSNRHHTKPKLHRQPSAYKGATEEAIYTVAECVKRRALFLINLVPASLSFVDEARKRWRLLAKYGGISETHDFKNHHEEVVQNWYNVVSEVQAASQLHKYMKYQRASSSRRRSHQLTSITEMVLDFVQGDAEETEIEYLMHLRNMRAKNRILGLKLLLGSMRASENRERIQTILAESFSHAMNTSKSLHNEFHLHYSNGIDGCNESLQKELSGAYGPVLSYLCTILKSPNIPQAGLGNSICSNASICSGESNTIDTTIERQHSTYEDLCFSVLKCIAIDYCMSDSYLLEESRFLAKLLVLLSKKRAGYVRRAAYSSLHLMLVRFIDGTATIDSDNLTSNAATAFQKRLLATVRLQLEGLVDDRSRQRRRSTSKLSMYDLRKDSPGQYAHHTNVGWLSTISFWIYVRDSVYTIQSGDSVRRGPNWGTGKDDDGGFGNPGSVLKVAGDLVTVRWMTTEIVKTYKYNLANNVREVMLYDDGPGGSIFLKGIQNISLDDIECTRWKYFGLVLTDSLRLKYTLNAGPEQDLTLESEAQVPIGSWTHVSLVQNREEFSFLFNASLTSHHRMNPESFFDTKGYSGQKCVESSHPYDADTDQSWKIVFPGATEVELAFDPCSRTASPNDFVVVSIETLDSAPTSFTYSGGCNKVPSTFPTEKLTLQSDTIAVRFHTSSRKISAWGFKITAIPKFGNLRTVSTPSENYNQFPIYFGQPPGRVADLKAANCCISGFRISNHAETTQELHEVMQNTSSAHFNSPKQFPTHRSLQVLSLLYSSCESSFGKAQMASPKIVKNLVYLVEAPQSPVDVKICALTVLQRVLQDMPPENADRQYSIQYTNDESITNDTRLVKSFLLQVGHSLNVWGHCNDKLSYKSNSLKVYDTAVSKCIELARAKAILVRNLACDDAHFDAIKEFIQQSTSQMSTVLASLESPSETVIDDQLNYSLQFLFGLAALVGGIYPCLVIGSRIKCCVVIDHKECIEVGTVLAQRISGDIQLVRVNLDCAPDEFHDIPISDVVLFEDTEDYGKLNLEKFYMRIVDELPAVQQILSALLNIQCSSNDKLTSQKITEEKNQIVESDHPYSGNLDSVYTVEFPGADAILVQFDSNCSTSNNDFVRFSRRHLSGQWGEDKYCGKNFGASTKPFRIPANSLDVYFHSDHESSDWGFRIKFTAIVETPLKSKEESPRPLEAALSDLRCRFLYAFSKLYNSNVKMDSFLPIFQPLVLFAVGQYEGKPVKPMPKTQIFESKHPYCNSISEYMTVNFAGASRLKIVFSEESKTENGCDYVVFYKDKSIQERWGEHQYTGRGGGENWPGCGGRPPLIIPSDTFTLYWCSDNSNVDWGWKFVVTAEFPSISPMDSPLETLEQRMHHCSETICEGIPLDVHSKNSSKGKLVKQLPKDCTINQAKFDCLIKSPFKNLGIQQREIVTALVHFEENEPKLLTDSTALNAAVANSWPKVFHVNAQDGVYIRLTHNTDSPALGVLKFGDSVTALDQHGDWVKMEFKAEGIPDNRFAWCRRREGDEFFLTRAVELHSEESIVLGVDDENSGPLSNAEGSWSNEEETPDIDRHVEYSPHAILEDFRGQTDRLHNLAFDTSEACSIKLARKCLATILEKESAFPKVSIENFSSVAEVILLLLQIPRGKPQPEKSILPNFSARKLQAFDKVVLSLIDAPNETPTANQLLNFCANSLFYGLHVLPKGRAVIRSLESSHPYDDGLNQCWKVSIPGAKRIKIVFDTRSRTESGCDWLCFYKNSLHHVKFGEDKYSGRGGNENWPGFGGRPPLWIESDYFEVFFHSDGSGNDWGFHFTAFGVLVEDSDMQNDESETILSKNKVIGQGLYLVHLAVWILELMSKSKTMMPNLLQSKLYIALMESLEYMPQAIKLRILNLLSLLASNQHLSLSNLSVERQDKLLFSLRDKVKSLYRAEEASETKSSYLQALIQCCLLVEMSLSKSLNGTQNLNDGSEKCIVSSVGRELGDKLIWQTDCGNSKHFEILMHGTVARKVLSNNLIPVSLRTQLGYASGVHTWEVIIQNGTSSIFIGIATENLSTIKTLGHDQNSFGWGEQEFCYIDEAGVNRVQFGSKFHVGDVIRCTLNLNSGSLIFHRNGAYVGEAIGLNGAVPRKLVGMYYPAVTLGSHGDQVLIRKAKITEKLHSIRTKLDWYTNFANTVEILKELQKDKEATSLLLRWFVRSLIKQETVVVASTHPFVPADHVQTISIPSAQCIKVEVDSRTRIGDVGTITLLPRGCDGTTLFGTDVEWITSASKLKTTSLQVGDLVVRGPDFEYGNDDGGAGFQGEVLEFVKWKDKENAAVRVKWLENDNVNIYRYQYHGFCDVVADQSVRSGRGSCRPELEFWSDSISLEIKNLSSPSDHNVSYFGSLKLGRNTHLQFKNVGQLNIGNCDFSIELWFRAAFENLDDLSPELENLLYLKQGTSQTTRVLRVLYDPMRCALSVALGNQNDPYANGIISRDAYISPDIWHHVTLCMHDCAAEVYLDGEEHVKGNFDLKLERDVHGEEKVDVYIGGHQKQEMNRGLQRRRRTLSAIPSRNFAGHVHGLKLWDSSLEASKVRLSAQHKTNFESKGLPNFMRTINYQNIGFVSIRSDKSHAVSLDNSSTKVYYEVTILGGGNIQVGWAFETCEPLRPTAGIGDCRYSFAVDLSRGIKWHQGPYPYKDVEWSPGDVLGCMLDTKDGTISYSLNGTVLGTAFNRSQHNPLIDYTTSVGSFGMQSPRSATADVNRDSGNFEDEEINNFLDTADDANYLLLLELLSLGFSRSRCAEALNQCNGDISLAIEHILEHHDSTDEAAITRSRRCSIDIGVRSPPPIPDLSGWSGYGDLRPAASLGIQGAQGLEWNFGNTPLHHLPEGYTSLHDFASENGSSVCSSLEVFVHERESWETIDRRHKLCGTQPTLISHWPLTEGTGLDLENTVDNKCNGRIIVDPIQSFFREDSDPQSWDKKVVNPFSEENYSWGYSIRFIPHFTPETVLQNKLYAARFSEFKQSFKAFTVEHDRQLVDFVNKIAREKEIGVEQLLRAPWSDLVESSEPFVEYPLLAGLSQSLDKATDVLQLRYSMLQEFNTSLGNILPLIDFHLMNDRWSLAGILSSSRSFIFNNMKLIIWKSYLAASQAPTTNIMEVLLNRPKAMRHKEKNLVDEDARHCLFSQAFRQLFAANPVHFRRDTKAYHVVFLGENSEDAGGPYSESLAQYCTELQSAQLSLLCPTPNAHHNVGQERGKWVLRSTARSKLQLEMFEFLGMLVGIAMRGGDYLGLNIASIIWKGIVNDTLFIRDLASIDAMLVSSMEKVRTIDQLGVTADIFEDIVMETFTTISSCDESLVLKPGGGTLAVTYDTRTEYADLVEHARLHEFDVQINAIRKGLGRIVPLHMLSLFTGAEAELMACGSPEISIDLLQQCTEYSSCAATDQHVLYFWECLHEFSHEDRSAFLRFAWGRSRLPSSSSQFPQWFKLQNFRHFPADTYLPIAHTCFFALELPAYSTKSILRQKLLYAIHNCQAIDVDGDTVAANQLGWEE